MKNLSPVDERVLPDSGRPCRSPQQSNYSSCLTFDTWANNGKLRKYSKQVKWFDTYIFLLFAFQLKMKC